MNTKDISIVIDLIDKQLCSIELKPHNKIVVNNLLELRNNILLKLKPDPNVDWTIKNNQLLKFFNKEIQWVKH